jgi:hypothetical protein
MSDNIEVYVLDGDVVELAIQTGDTVEVSVQDGDTVEINFYDTLNISMAMELTGINITVGANVIPHTLNRPVSFLTAFYNNRLISLDWTNIDPDTSLESDVNIYIPDSLAAFNNVTLYIL